jgi:hypothetical protein
MPTAEADIETEHAARYLARLCGRACRRSAGAEHLAVKWQDLGG